MLALVLSQLLAQAAPAYLSSCPAQAGRMTQAAIWLPPDVAHATNRRVRFYLDLGSDGRVRRAAIVESSGDANFDAKALEAVQTTKYAPPTQNCISTSSVTSESYNVPLLALTTPPPAGVTGGISALPTNAPAASIAVCTSTYVQLAGLDVPAQRQKPGTVTIDVGLSAQAKVTSVELAKSSGSKALDDLGTASARSAQYEFVLPPGCAPKPTTYRLELTYH